MANDITEDDIEVSLLNILKGDDLGYNIVRCDPGKENKENINDGTGRSSKRQCVLPKVVRDSLYKINPTIPKILSIKLSIIYVATLLVQIWLKLIMITITSFVMAKV